jgi:adenylylsulfate kinase-like enzyme
MYAKARTGEIGEFTGISSPYEIPENPEIIINTDCSVEENCEKIIAYLVQNNFISS